MEHAHYVYAHFSSETGKPFYIGKGSGKRWRSPNGRSLEWAEAACGGFTPKIVTGLVPEACSFCIERILIYAVGRDNLINKSDGGHGGGSGSKRGWLQRLVASSKATLAHRDPVKAERIAAGIRKPEKYTIAHAEHGTHEATRHEMKTLHGFSSSGSTSLIKGTYKSYLGWRIIR